VIDKCKLNTLVEGITSQSKFVYSTNKYSIFANCEDKKHCLCIRGKEFMLPCNEIKDMLINDDYELPKHFIDNEY
jgi:hypothetical protein